MQKCAASAEGNMENLLQISVLFSPLFFAVLFVFLLKKMLTSALGSMTENSNNPIVFLSVSVLNLLASPM